MSKHIVTTRCSLCNGKGKVSTPTLPAPCKHWVYAACEKCKGTGIQNSKVENY